MAEVNWGLLNRGPGALEHFGYGMQLGQDLRARQDAKDQKNALAAYVQNPNEQTLGGVTTLDPALGLKLKQQEAESAAAKREQDRQQLVIMGKLLRHAKDEGTYQQALAAAKQYGLPVDRAPPNFDPNWVQQNLMIVDAFEKDGGAQLTELAKNVMHSTGFQPGTPEFQQAMSQAFTAQQTKTIPFTEGGGVAGFNPMTGTTTTIVAPNPGGFAAGTPVGAGQRKTVGGKTYEQRGGKWYEVGGASSNAGGNFQN